VIDDRSVPLVVLIVAVVVLLAVRPIAITTRAKAARAQTPSIGPEAIERLAEQLGIGIMVESVDAGPPASIVATGLLDNGRTRLMGTGPTEDEAWRDLGRAAIAWKREDGRNVRFWWGA
jgi:hypothetical protein